MNDNTATENLVEYPACYAGRITRAQARRLSRERHAWQIAARLGDVTESRMDAARKALRRVIRAGNVQARIMEAENSASNYDADGHESRGLRALREIGDNADKAARKALAPFGLRLTYPGPYPLIEPADGNGPQIFPEY